MTLTPKRALTPTVTLPGALLYEILSGAAPFEYIVLEDEAELEELEELEEDFDTVRGRGRGRGRVGVRG